MNLILKLLLKIQTAQQSISLVAFIVISLASICTNVRTKCYDCACFVPFYFASFFTLLADRERHNADMI